MKRLAGLMILACGCVAAGPASQPASAPATEPSTAPTTATAPAVDPAARKLLEQLEQAGRDHPRIQADVEYEVLMRKVGDRETRWGQVRFQRAEGDEPARFHIVFDVLRQGDGPKIADKVEYAFDGQWLTELKHRIRQQTLYQVAAEGEKIDAFRIGRGPFPMPFGQKAEDMIAHFEPSTRPPADGDPKDTDYLRLVTRPEHAKDIQFTDVEMWIDRATRLPVRLVSRDRKKDRTTVVFTNLKTDVEFDKSVFRPGRKLGWEYHVKRLGE